MNPDLINIYESRKHFCQSSVPKVEVNVISSVRGEDNLSITSRSVEKIPLKSIPNYRSIFESKINHANKLRWSNHVKHHYSNI
jgi:hypothetical protein